MKAIESLTDSKLTQSSVETLITLLWIKTRIPAGQHWPIFEASLSEQADKAANRIIYHAQFALDHLTQ
jgi:hypothetical protein